MPEIGEVARIVHFLRQTLLNRTLATVTAVDDANVFGKAGTTGTAFEKALTGKKVVDVGRQGKYFWLIMSSPPHPVFHFGMTGWWEIKGLDTYYYKEPKASSAIWPPKFWKFQMTTTEEPEKPKVEAAFIDSRRFARVRLVDCAGADIRKTTPLKENGPDPVLDANVLTLEWLTALMKKKHVPVKALLLDQANISGIGNWVGDEILYNARLHPEQYSDTFTTAQLSQLHISLLHICETAVDLLADSSRFPEDWLFKHRWGKGKKDSPTALPNGNKITFLTVGGRTSCVVPNVQKKTGAVAGDVKESKGVGKQEGGVDGESVADKGKVMKKPVARGKKAKLVKEEKSDEEDVKAESTAEDEPKPKGKKRKADTISAPEKKQKINKGPSTVKVEVSKDTAGRRRSMRGKD